MAVADLPQTDFRLLAESMPVMMWHSDPEGGCEWANASLLSFKGRRLEDERGSGWQHALHPDEHAGILSACEKDRTEQTPFMRDMRLRRHDGVFRWMKNEGRPFFQAGTFSGFVCTYVDITEHREAEAGLRDALAEREVLLREVHHRVKNNLQTLMALIRFMRRDATGVARDVLDLLHVRISTMATVQKYLHAADNLIQVPARDLLHSTLPDLADLGIQVQFSGSTAADFEQSGQAAAYLGLAVSEAVLLLARSGVRNLEVEMTRGEGGTPAILVRGAGGNAAQLAGELGVRLVRQYARGAGARIHFPPEDGGLSVVIALNDER